MQHEMKDKHGVDTKRVIGLSLVIPVYNEEANLEELIRRCIKVCDQGNKEYEIILIDDGSQDKSSRIIKNAAKDNPCRVIGIILNRNYGQHAAVMAGLEHSHGDAVVTLDADLQNPPEEIPKLLDAIDEGYDVVGSVRQQRQDSLFRRLSSRLINKAVQMSTGVMLNDYGCMLRAYRRRIVDAMVKCHEHSTFIPVLANTFTNKTTEVPVAHVQRSNDDSKYNLWKLINLQFDLLTNMTTFPLRLLSLMGGAIALLGFMFSFMLLAMRLFYGVEWAVGGVLTAFSVLFIFIGVQLLALGILGEYIGRIYTGVRSRPRYFVDELIIERTHTTVLSNVSTLTNT